MSVRELTEADVVFTLDCEPEDMPFVGNCSAIDPKTDKRAEEWIRKQLEAGNEWAWCHVVVKARWKGFVGRDTLGGCSYKSEADFKHPSGYYPQMKAEALADLNRQVQVPAADLAEIEEN